MCRRRCWWPVCLALVVSTGPADAAVITQWDFNGVAGVGTTAPSTGSGTLSLAGTVFNGYQFAQSGFGNSSDPQPVHALDRTYTIRGFPDQSTGNKTEGLQVQVSTVGYADIVVQWDQSSQPTSSRWGQFQYSIDGTTFLDFGPLIENVRTSFDIWDNGHVRDLSAVSGVANNPNFAFRIVAAFALPANTSYQAITGSYNLNDFWAFDMVTVSGETYIPPPSGVPEPASCLLLGVALLGGVAVRLRSRNSAIRRTGQTC